jgi:hypothetical protein
MYVFDSTPMWFAILLFNIVHPGKYMPGRESDLPSRKEYRREKKAAKAGKKAAKAAKKAGFVGSDAYQLDGPKEGSFGGGVQEVGVAHPPTYHGSTSMV